MMSLGLKMIIMVAGIVLAGSSLCRAQNLIVNGGFEDGNTCQEFHLPCGPAAWVTLPVKTKVVFYGTDKEKKKQSNHHFGLIVENTKNPVAGRTYVQTMLCQPLVAGQRYRLTMRCFTGPAPFEQIGVLIANWIPSKTCRLLLLLRPTARRIKPISKNGLRCSIRLRRPAVSSFSCWVIFQKPIAPVKPNTHMICLATSCFHSMIFTSLPKKRSWLI